MAFAQKLRTRQPSKSSPTTAKLEADSAPAPPNAPPPRATTSTFLPSLNVGYILGESDASDLEAEDQALDRLEKERTRKNRRGQRARRAIWEKKYGKAAKHLQKGRAQRHAKAFQPPHSKSGKHDPQRPSFKKTDHRIAPQHQQKTNPPAATADSLARKGVVHPSWEAKQKQNKAISEVKPSGKKIVFD